MLVDFGKANFIQKAKQQPDKVKMVLDKVKTDGLRPTLEAVFNKLGQPLPLGYCNVGKVVAVGKGVSEFSVGDRVASNGNHAEYVCIPKNLVVKIPDNVSDDEATFTVIGAIGLQGIRLLQPTFGETIVVVGLGLIGLITAELLLANGCNVIGFDFDNEKIKIAREKGIKAINPSEKSIIFCATQAHAALIRDLINQESVDRPTDYCVRVTANDGDIGETYLKQFQDNEKTIPTILTTSRKLSTGVDARNVRCVDVVAGVGVRIGVVRVLLLAADVDWGGVDVVGTRGRTRWSPPAGSSCCRS